jgi:hypothetical protein
MTDRTTAELEHDAEMARARVADTAESIRNRMTPGQLIDEFSGLFSGGDGAAALGNLKAQVRDNPLPLTLIGTGLAWLMLGNAPATNSTSKPSRRTSNPDYSDSNGMDTAAFADRAGDATDGMVSAVGSSARAVGDLVSDAVAAVGSMADQSAQQARGNLSEGKRWVDSVANSTTSGARDLSAKARQSAADLFESEPLVIAALGLAVGTAIGAMLPRTSLEDQNLGAYSDKLRDTAQDLMEKGVEGAKEVAAEAYQTVKEEADRQGGSGEKSIVDKVTEVVRSTSAKAEESIRDKITPT